MKYLLFLLCPLIAFSFEHDPLYSFDAGLGGGYRQDSMKFTMTEMKPVDSPFPVELLNQSYKKLKAPIIESFVTEFIHNFLLHAEGNYTWFSTGRMNMIGITPIAPPINQIIRSPFKAKAEGNAFDIYGNVGYAIKILPPFEVIILLIPDVGYSYHYQNIDTVERKKEIPLTVVGMIAPANDDRSIQRYPAQ